MSELFANLSDALADTVEQVSAGVVRVDGRRRLSATGIVWRDGVIVSANHVVRFDEGLKVGLPDGETVPASLVGRDQNTDIAVLKVEAGIAPVAVAADALRAGHLVLALGRPRNNIQATLGVVSATGEGRMDGAIQTDVVMYPGFSGGPLVDASGKVQGMNTSGFMRGASIALSSSLVNRVIDILLAHGHMRQGYLGIGVQPVRLPEEAAAETNQETGLMVASVESGSPAASAGVLLGDIVTALDGQPTPHLDSLLDLLGGDRVGSTVPIKLIRGGAWQELSVTIGEKQS